MIVVATLTVVPVLTLITPLHLAQRKMYDPRIALLLELFALLFWLAAFTAMASYLDIFKYYGRTEDDAFPVGCRKCRRAYKSAIAATVFAALEFMLFFISTLLFIYYYHHHMAGTPASGFGRHEEHTKDENATIGTAAAGTHRHETNGTTGGYGVDGSQMSSLPYESSITNGNHGTGMTGPHETGMTDTHRTGVTGMHGPGLTETYGNLGPQQSSTGGQYNEIPYPEQPRQGSYGRPIHDSQGAGRYGTNTDSNVV